MLVKRTMYTFNVATANGPALGNAMAGPGLWGIDAPYELKKDVWSMKRGQGIAGVEAAYNAAPSVASMDRSGGGQGIVVGTDGGQGIEDRLEKLASLHERGALSDAEFATAKANLLGL